MSAFTKFLSNDRGVTIVNALIGISLTAIAAVALLKLSEKQARQQKRTQLDGDFNEIHNHIKTILSQRATCNISLAGRKRGERIGRLLSSADPTIEPYAVASKEKTFRHSKLFLTEMRLLTKDEASRVPTITHQPGIVVLELTFQRPGDVDGGKTIKKQIEVRVHYGAPYYIRSPLGPRSVVLQCKKSGGTQAYIVDSKTLLKAEAEEQAVTQVGNQFAALCVDPNEAAPNAAIITCLTNAE